MIQIKIRFLLFRDGISFKTISGEMSAVTEEMTVPWNETTLPTLLSNYKLGNVFNADDFGLFYQYLPTKTYHLPREKCPRGKNSKVRLTGMAAASAAGESYPYLLLGNPKHYDALKILSNSLVDIEARRKVG